MTTRKQINDQFRDEYAGSIPQSTHQSATAFLRNTDQERVEAIRRLVHLAFCIAGYIDDGQRSDDIMLALAAFDHDELSPISAPTWTNDDHAHDRKEQMEGR